MGNINLSSGAITPLAVINAIKKIDLELQKTRSFIGTSEKADNDGKGYISSLSAAIGNMSDVSISVPSGVVFTNWKDSFSPVGRNDFYLSLVPIGSPTVIGDNGVNYIQVDEGFGNDDNEYSISGRRITFVKKPEQPFSVVYKGKYPSIGREGYNKNVMPNPDMLISGQIKKPTIELLSENNYKLTLPRERHIYGVEVGQDIPYSLPEHFEQYISGSGSIKAPSEIISLWKLFNGEFHRVEDADIYILSSEEYMFSTESEINVSADVFVISVQSWSISQAIGILTKMILTHSHNGTEIDSPVIHKNLSGNISDRYNHGDKEFGRSKVLGDDHPQYFHRDGYIADNTGNFNNAILGDVLIGSSNPHNMHNNILGSSRKIFFGSVSEASSIMFDHIFKGLKIYGTSNGLKIETHSDQGAQGNQYGVGISVDGNKIYSTGDKDGELNVLNIEAKNGTVKFPNTEGGLSTIIAKSATLNSLTSEELNITKEGGSLKIGNIAFTNKDSNVEVTSKDDKVIDVKSDMTAGKIAAKEIVPDNISISGDAKISFGESSISNMDGAIAIKSDSALILSNTGRGTGIQNKSGNYEHFFNMYSASESGSVATPTDHDTYLEAGTGDVFFIKNTGAVATDNGKSYVFGKNGDGGESRIDNLKSWPKANIHGSLGDFRSINVETSSLKERRGINFADVSSIYTTGNDTECPPGWLVVESRNGVVFVENRSGAIDCQTMVYSQITSGGIQAFGNVSVDKNLGVYGNIDTNGSISSRGLNVSSKAKVGSLEVVEESRFTGTTSFTEDVKINSSLSVGGSISTLNRIQGNELSIQSSAHFAGPVSFKEGIHVKGDTVISGRTNITGDINISGAISASDGSFVELSTSKLKSIEAIDARGGLVAEGKISSSGSIETASDIIADGGKFSTQVKTRNLIVERDQTVDGELFVRGKSQFAGDVTIGSVNSNKVFVNGDMTINNKKTSFIGTADFSDEVSFRNSASFVGTVDMQSSVTMSGGLNLSGPTVSKSTAEFDSLRVAKQSYIGGDQELSGSLRVEKDANIYGDMVVKGNSSFGQKGTTLVVSSDAQFNNEKTLFSGEISISNKLNISGSTTISSTLDIDGEVVASGNMSVAGVLKVSTIQSSALAEFKGGIRSSRQSQFESISVQDRASFGGDIVADGEIQSTGGIYAAPESKSNFGSVNVLGGISQADSNANNQFAGQGIFNNSITVAGEANVRGSIRTGTQNSGAIIENNTIRLIGDTSFLSTRNAEINEIAGKSRRVIPSIGSRNSTATYKTQELSQKDYTIINNAYVSDSHVTGGDIFCMGTLYVGSIEVIEVPGSSRRFEDSGSSVLNIRAARARYAP